MSEDTGTPASPNGDGTLVDAALLSALQDHIDELLTVGGDGAPGVLTVGADLQVDGFGSHTFAASGSGVNRIIVRNTSAGTTNLSAYDIGNDSAAVRGRIYVTSSTYTPTSHVKADGMHLESLGVGGLTLVTTDAAGDIVLATSSTQRMLIDQDGRVSVFSPSTGGTLNISGDSALPPDSSTYGRCLQTNRTTLNTGQHIALIRAGTYIWSIGYAYGTSTFAIGAGSTTDANFTGAAAALTITTANEVQAPNQPGFLAYNSSTDAGVTATGDRTIEFDTEAFDTGSDYNTSTDAFTAPVTGRFALSTCVYVTNQEGSARQFTARFALSVGADYFFAANAIDAGASHAFSGSITVDMAAGETASVVLTPGGVGSPNYDIASTSSGDRLTWFGGRLLV